MFTELKGKLDGNSSDCMVGAKLRFKTGAITGYMTTTGQMFSTYTKMINPQMGLKMDINSRLDLKNPNNCLFGITLGMGGM